MKGTDRNIMIGVGLAALVAAFLFFVLMPKRNEAKKVSDEVAKAQESADSAVQELGAAKQAKHDFPVDYHRLVVMGKAVPTGDDTSSLLVQLNRIAHRNDVEFRGIELTADSSAPSAPPPGQTSSSPGSGQSGSGGSGSQSGGSTGSSTTNASNTSGAGSTGGAGAAAATPTEASAASLPIGATVGSAGLPVMPYKLTFRGDFFQIGDFIAGVQRLVDPKTGHVTVSGRLVTFDGFSFSRDPKEGFPKLLVSFAVTTYMTPREEGLTAGATPSGPAPPSDTTTVSNSTTTGTAP